MHTCLDMSSPLTVTSIRADCLSVLSPSLVQASHSYTPAFSSFTALSSSNPLVFSGRRVALASLRPLYLHWYLGNVAASKVHPRKISSPVLATVSGELQVSSKVVELGGAAAEESPWHFAHHLTQTQNRYVVTCVRTQDECVYSVKTKEL